MNRTVVVIEAIDWAQRNAQVDSDTVFTPITGVLCGFLVSELKGKRGYVTLTQQIFPAEDQVRCVLTVPNVNIISRLEFPVEKK